jgi:5-bromo-4-chloroindolyl phosphate hydrolysis protein
MLFTAGFIIAIVILIQYLSFIYIKKQIKIEIVKTLEVENNHSGKEISNKEYLDKNNLKETEKNKERKDKDNESYDIDTPENNEMDGDADSYVNPLKSVKGDDDTEEDK